MERRTLNKLKELFDNNAAWAEATKKEDPEFFARLATQQNPSYLWIGCSDSRVSPNRIVDLPPGELFVHRNIANLVIHDDLNCMSAIQFAVEALQIEHIIICGHYNCGGIRAALENVELGLIDNWLKHIKEVIRIHKEELGPLSFEEKCTRLCELNVIEQVRNICATDIIKSAWKNNKNLSIYGLIYSPQNGALNDLNVNLGSTKDFDNYYN